MLQMIYQRHLLTKIVYAVFTIATAGHVQVEEIVVLSLGNVVVGVVEVVIEEAVVENRILVNYCVVYHPELTFIVNSFSDVRI